MKITSRRALLAAAMITTLTAGAGVVVHADAPPKAGAGPSGCFDPAAFGAVPDDGADDRVPIQAAIDAATTAGGGTVCLGSGRWRVTRAPVGSFDRFAALSTHGAHLTFTGTGPGTVLELVGDQQAGAVAVLSLDPGASDITVAQLKIDTSATTNTDEQTHAIAIGSGVCAGATCSLPVADITVRDVVFAHPATPGFRKGDCIRLLGNTPATAVRRVTISGGSFTSCARSGIGVQRNVFSLAVLGNHFGEQIGDTAFDGEATGGDWDDGLRLEGNSFADSTVTFSASLTSYRHATITGNTFSGRGLSLYRTQDVIVADNTFDVTAVDGSGAIDIANVASGDKIDNNLIRRHGVPGTAIRITPHSGGIPAQMTVTNNTIITDGDSNGIYADSVRDIGIRDNDITFTEAAPNGSGIQLQAITGPFNETMITGNTITGPLSDTGANTYFAAVRLDSRPELFHGVTVALNASHGAIRSLQCSQRAPGGFAEPIVSTGNRWNVAPTCVAVLQPGQ
ncbi:right-handed parallel beta-helix repeat-containing protein [Actinocrispum sp. NPDC049592]|uniref:right-handed parallel beta-helix repeat-containing protein n=1 Tax=Actinocrispum sp. NPDC049592 TaxID=3154835 RepID=UPI00342856EB